MTNVGILGIGSYAPEKVFTNFDFEKFSILLMNGLEK
jgi:3-oxoacyl-[acyl-carrier-protein] synthase III